MQYISLSRAIRDAAQILWISESEIPANMRADALSLRSRTARFPRAGTEHVPALRLLDEFIEVFLPVACAKWQGLRLPSEPSCTALGGTLVLQLCRLCSRLRRAHGRR